MCDGWWELQDGKVALLKSISGIWEGALQRHKLGVSGEDTTISSSPCVIPQSEDGVNLGGCPSPGGYPVMLSQPFSCQPSGAGTRRDGQVWCAWGSARLQILMVAGWLRAIWPFLGPAGGRKSFKMGRCASCRDIYRTHGPGGC